jgi:hypothetical protein
MERNSYTSLRAGNSAIILDRAKDSHEFFSEGTAYFHVNFKAGAGQHGPYYTFFAEVNGPAGVPENVTMVAQFHTKGMFVHLHIYKSSCV